jgi:hypothetical protein
MERACLSFLNADSSVNTHPISLTKISLHKRKPKNKTRKTLKMPLDDKQRREDLEAVVKHVKDDLFAKVKFIYDPKVDLAVGGKTYVDYKSKCRNQIGARGSSVENHDTHMESIWNMAMTKHMQKNALAQKRSAVHTVMQNKFAGELLRRFCSSEVLCLLD